MIEKQVPKVSVIIPTYNRVHLLSRAIESVLGQTHQNFEIIVVDDGSTDGTKQLIAHLQKKHNSIKYFYQANLGACSARNKGLELASGEFVQFLDSDDYMTQDKIKIQVDIMENEGTSCAICDFQYIDSKGNILKSTRNNGNIHSYVANFRSPYIMTPLIRTTSIIHELKWNLSLKRNQDMDFMFKYFMTIRNWSYTPGFFCKYVTHDGSQISNSYHKGVQCFTIYKSMYNFIIYSRNKIPQENRWVLRRYRNKLVKIYLRQQIRKLLQKVKIWNLLNCLRSRIHRVS
ncbi:MAG: glycosyltransferase family 2 protein [Candidatus Thermoplasmatota archaeon]|nr:glycosyltransferase family 2 protein [Candidatus Thermoplasmatota archaeon]